MHKQRMKKAAAEKHAKLNEQEIEISIFIENQNCFIIKILIKLFSNSVTSTKSRTLAKEREEF
ncbi:CLUMA_CG008257, isoform A [Clunio marinus]|uniref:CLUMA_CG008257, isoform A n=1 Tax=Clunio marinus TaxID=568069 RepID=A0A1J1I3I9_9DIPT|nr:CLUMA_CG008257, isoform A [Clunio marinus]